MGILSMHCLGWVLRSCIQYLHESALQTAAWCHGNHCEAEPVPAIIQEISEVLKSHNVKEVLMLFKDVDGNYCTLKRITDIQGMVGHMEIIKTAIILDYGEEREFMDLEKEAVK
jgi:hypothetical protein